MGTILWRHSLTVCHELLRLLNNNPYFTNARLYIAGINFRIDQIQENTLGILLQQEPHRNSTTTILIDADYLTENGGVNTKFVLHFCPTINQSTLIIVDPNSSPIEVVATHFLNPTDPVDICATSYYEQLMSTYND